MLYEVITKLAQRTQITIEATNMSMSVFMANMGSSVKYLLQSRRTKKISYNFV